jgi:hypothetical protein
MATRGLGDTAYRLCETCFHRPKQPRPSDRQDFSRFICARSLRKRESSARCVAKNACPSHSRPSWLFALLGRDRFFVEYDGQCECLEIDGGCKTNGEPPAHESACWGIHSTRSNFRAPSSQLRNIVADVSVSTLRCKAFQRAFHENPLAQHPTKRMSFPSWEISRMKSFSFQESSLRKSKSTSHPSVRPSLSR